MKKTLAAVTLAGTAVLATACGSDFPDNRTGRSVKNTKMVEVVQGDHARAGMNWAIYRVALYNNLDSKTTKERWFSPSGISTDAGEEGRIRYLEREYGWLTVKPGEVHRWRVAIEVPEEATRITLTGLIGGTHSIPLRPEQG